VLLWAWAVVDSRHTSAAAAIGALRIVNFPKCELCDHTAALM
jgi:hypothetical protein